MERAIDETYRLAVLATNGGYDHQLVREALEVDGEYLIADDSATER